MAPRKVQISVVGAGRSDSGLTETARSVGRAIAEAGGTLVCGGMDGVMAGACRGATEAGGVAVAILPGNSHHEANPWATVVIPSGLGHARNVLVVQSGHAVVALRGSHGTLSEIALALKMGRPVVGLGAWEQLSEVRQAETPEGAVRLAMELGGQGGA